MSIFKNEYTCNVARSMIGNKKNNSRLLDYNYTCIYTYTCMSVCVVYNVHSSPS